MAGSTTLWWRFSTGVAKAGWSRGGLHAGGGALMIWGAASAILQVGSWDGASWLLGATAVVGALVGLARLTLPAARVVMVPGCDSSIEIRVADLFDSKTHIVVAIGELVDYELGQKVAPQSVHGQCITRFFNDDPKRFHDGAVNSLTAQGIEGRNWQDDMPLRYPVGATAVLDVGPTRLFLPILTHCDVQHDWKAHANIADLWSALEGLWKLVRTRSNAEPVTMPLMGSGLANINLPMDYLLDTIVSSFVAASSRDGRVTKKLTVALTEGCYRKMDLRKLCN